VAETALTSLGISDRELFLGTQWERQPVLIRSGLRGGVRNLLDPVAFAALASARPAGVSVVAEGVARPVGPDASPAAVFDAYADGCTVLAAGIETGCRAAADLCRALELEFLAAGVPLREGVGANAFLTPARSRGFNLHYDNHCAFVLQVHGRKRWEVFAPLEELPLDRCETAVPLDRAGEPLLRSTLDAGDMLYIPRGFPHWAESAGTSSLHVTLSLRTVTWADMAAELVRESAPLRRSAGDGFPQDRLVADVHRWNAKDYRDARVARSLAGLRPLPGDPVTALDAIAATGLDTPLAHAERTACRATVTPDAAILLFPGSRLRLPPEMAPVVEFVARTPAFRPRDLPEIPAGYDRVELACRLVTRGLLVAAPQKPAAPAGSTLLRPDGSGPGGHHLDWLRAGQPLTGAECDAVIAASEAFPTTEPTTVGQERHPGRRQVVSRQLGLTADTRWFLELILRLSADASAGHYGFRLSGITRPPQYLEYRPGRGHFDRHNDYSHDQADSPRKLTVIVQLSEPGDYDGGRLSIHAMETEELPAERGSILLFPSFLYHSVSPVTRGVRRALVCWIAGPRLT
jgi:PKHD-type hydroxylase